MKAKIYLKVITLLLAVCTLFALPLLTNADSFQTEVYVGTTPTIYPCDTTSTTGPSTCSFSATGISATGSSLADLATGTVGDSTQISTTGGTVGGVHADTVATYDFSGLTASTLQFTFSAEGTSTAPGYPDGTGVFFGIDAYLYDNDTFAPGTPNQTIYPDANFAVALGNGTTSNILVDVPVVDGTAELNYILVAEADCEVGVNCSASADFADTLAITGAEAYDANGNLIPNATIVSESGFNPNATNTPEPSSVLLLGVGLLGLMLMSLLGKRPGQTAQESC